MPYPPRTRASDAIARNLFIDLAQGNVANGGQNRCMVTVVVTGDVEIPTAAFIATSGGAGAFGGLRTAVNNLRGHGIYGGVDYTLVVYTGHTNLIRPANSNLQVRVDAPFLLANPRDCAEPKALEVAASTGRIMSGMSTFWWGNNANPYPDPSPDPAPVQVPWALPCDICSTNEANIMRRMEALRLFHRSGVPIRSAEV